MKYLLLATLLFVGCAKETVTVEKGAAFDNTRNEQRLSALEAAQQLDLANDALVEARISALELSLATEISARQSGDEALAQEISALRSQMSASMTALSNDIRNYIDVQISTVNQTNSDLAARVSVLEGLSSTVSSLVNRVTALETGLLATTEDLEAFKLLVNGTYATMDMLTAVEGNVSTLSTMVATLSGTVTSLQTELATKASLVKAPCANAKEMLLKVGNTYYADINTSSLMSVVGISVLGSSSSYIGQLATNTTYTTNDGTNCRFKATPSGNLIQQ